MVWFEGKNLRSHGSKSTFSNQRSVRFAISRFFWVDLIYSSQVFGLEREGRGRDHHMSKNENE